MKNNSKIIIALLLFSVFMLMSFSNSVSCQAKSFMDDGSIKKGIWAQDIELSGMTEQEAVSAIENYIEDLREKKVELVCAGGGTLHVAASELGIKWENRELIKEAMGYGSTGNVLERYKAKKDLQREKKIFDIEIGCDDAMVREVVAERCISFDKTAKDATLTREGGKFNVTPGSNGEAVNVQESIEIVKTHVADNWSREENDRIELCIDVVEPKGKTEDLEQITDVLGTFTTSFSTSAKGRSANVRNGCSLVNGTLLYPGEQFSFYEKVNPFTEENGYYLAGSYNNGLVVETLGGGICQVSSTLYNAVIRAELQVDQRSNHSMVVSYVDLSADAAISGTSKDFKFTNSTDYPIYIAGSTSEDKKITFSVYGKETRPDNRTLSFESEKISEEVPEGEKIIADSEQPVGYYSTQSAHTGYTANYWKIVKVDGQETERVKLNSSHYQATPKTVTFGVSGDATGAMRAAIDTQSSEHCKQVASELLNAANAANIAAAEAAAAQTAQQAID